MTQRRPRAATGGRHARNGHPGMHAKDGSRDAPGRQPRADTGPRVRVRAVATRQDLAAGEPSAVDERHPVAIAVARVLGLTAHRTAGPHVRVGDDWFSIHVMGAFYESHDLPEGAAGWIRGYDCGEDVGPLAFEFATAWPAAQTPARAHEFGEATSCQTCGAGREDAPPVCEGRLDQDAVR